MNDACERRERERERKRERVESVSKSDKIAQSSTYLQSDGVTQGSECVLRTKRRGEGEGECVLLKEALP